MNAETTTPNDSILSFDDVREIKNGRSRWKHGVFLRAVSVGANMVSGFGLVVFTTPAFCSLVRAILAKVFLAKRCEQKNDCGFPHKHFVHNIVRAIY